jgi:peptidoglycan hydrolase CwlO-like protein
LSEKEIALQDVKQTQQQIHDLNQILDDQANEFKAFDNDYHTVFNQLQTTSNKVNELREKRNQLTSELTQLVMDEPIPSIFQDTVDRGVSTVKSASEQRCSDLESKIKDMEKALANTMLTIEDGQKKIDSANNELSKAHDAFEQTRFDANAM